MSKEKFKVGDLVVLAKLNGPKMVVVDADKKGTVVCLWFNSDHTLQTGSFPLALVEALPVHLEPEPCVSPSVAETPPSDS
jgi:uncharacterized protein YodC (DUF2158 family)